MLKSSLCDYSDAYILAKGRITIAKAGDNVRARQAGERNRGITYKTCVPFINYKSELNNTEIDNAKDIDSVMPIHNLIEYSDNYSKASGGLWQCYRDEPKDNLTDSESFKSKIKITAITPADSNMKDFEIIVRLKHWVIFGELLKCH